jgi:hypothetical protein
MIKLSLLLFVGILAKPKLEIFGEPFCPACQHLVHTLSQLKSLTNHIDISMVFYGFAYETGEKTFHCHHGNEECELMTHLNCLWS